MSKTPKVSIIIPTKNEAKNIGFCLDSIFSIDYSAAAYEVLVVDNGSADQTTLIAAEKGAQVYSLPHVNISTLRNFGTRQAKGDIFAFLDADCTVDKDWLVNAEKYFEAKNIVCFGSTPRIPDKPTWVQAAWFHVRQKKKGCTEVAWLESMNMFIRRDIYESVGGFNETLVTCEDVDLSYRLSARGRIISDQEIRAIHHGEAKDIAEFFRKERWRGKSNYLGLQQHGLRLDEIPSLLLPPYYLFMSSLIVVWILFGHWNHAAVVFFLLQVPILAIALLKIQRHSAYIYFFQLYFLYNIYYLARGLALFKR